jgi:uncharacterized protein (DUF952 family)
MLVPTKNVVVRFIKILTPREYATLYNTKEFTGTPKDVKSGFMHLSYGHQVNETIQKHYLGYKKLYLVEFRPEMYNLLVQKGYPHFYTQKLYYSDVLSVETKLFNDTFDL